MLSLSQRQVQRLARTNRLASSSVAGRTVISGRSLTALERTAARGRHWSDETVAAALDLLTDGATTALQAAPRSRLRARLREIDARELAYQALSGRVSLWRSTSASLMHPGSLATTELGLTGAGGTRVRSCDDVGVDARQQRLVEDEEGDVVLVALGRARALTAEIITLYAYGDARESGAAAAWIAKKVRALR